MSDANREILFRGKLVYNGEWQESQCPIGTMSAGVVQYDFDLATVGAYTGLRDKNGTKIFEGDIISHKEYVFTVGWFDEYAGFYPFFDQDNPAGYGVEAANCEVIGNIYDNSELKKNNAKL